MNVFLIVYLFPLFPVLQVWAVHLQDFGHLKKLAVHEIFRLVDFQELTDD